MSRTKAAPLQVTLALTPGSRSMLRLEAIGFPSNLAAGQRELKDCTPGCIWGDP